MGFERYATWSKLRKVTVGQAEAPCAAEAPPNTATAAAAAAATIRAARTIADDTGRPSGSDAAGELLLARLALERHILGPAGLVAHRAGPSGAADVGFRPPLEQAPRADRTRFDTHDRQRLRLVDEERKRCDVTADQTPASRLDHPAEGHEGPLESPGKLAGQTEGEALPVGLLEGLQLRCLDEQLLVEPDRDPAVADASVGRPAEQALAADELRGNVEPGCEAPHAHGDRAAVVPFAAALDSTLDLAPAPRLGPVEADAKAVRGLRRGDPPEPQPFGDLRDDGHIRSSGGTRRPRRGTAPSPPRTSCGSPPRRRPAANRKCAPGSARCRRA